MFEKKENATGIRGADSKENKIYLSDILSQKTENVNPIEEIHIEIIEIDGIQRVRSSIDSSDRGLFIAVGVIAKTLSEYHSESGILDFMVKAVTVGLKGGLIG